MIAKLTGKIDELRPTDMILDVNGVGYSVQIPFSTYQMIQNEKEISLYIFTLHKEDQFRLFGFYTEQEKNIFSILLNINGIGPAMALSLLSGISIDRLIDAVKNEKTSLLIKIPGIGKSKAEKLIFELKRKLKKLEKFSGDTILPSMHSDAVDALVSLGFEESKSLNTVNEIIRETPDAAIETIIKQALKFLSS